MNKICKKYRKFNIKICEIHRILNEMFYKPLYKINNLTYLKIDIYYKTINNTKKGSFFKINHKQILKLD